MFVVLYPTEKWGLALLLALLPFAPVWGWVCFGGLAGVVVHLRDAWRGFPRLVGLLAALLGVLPFYFEQLVFVQGASASTPLFSREKGRGF